MSKLAIGSTDSESAESVSIAVVTAVARRRDVSATDLPPLYEWIDPDALDALFASTRTGGPRRGRIDFTYAGHEIAIDCEDGIEITVDGTPVAEPVSVGVDSTAGSRTDA